MINKTDNMTCSFIIIVCIISVVLFALGCYHRPEDEHWKLYSENYSEDTILVFDHCWHWGGIMPEPDIPSNRGFGVPRENILTNANVLKSLIINTSAIFNVSQNRHIVPSATDVFAISTSRLDN